MLINQVIYYLHNKFGKSDKELAALLNLTEVDIQELRRKDKIMKKYIWQLSVNNNLDLFLVSEDNFELAIKERIAILEKQYEKENTFKE